MPAIASDPPLVSVITVCWNAAATLEACLASVAAQTYPAIEHVIIDGASTDGTAAILARHRDRIAVLVSEPDRGLYDAMNKGVARASGTFVIFMNADDHFATPRAVEQAMAEIQRGPEADVFYGSILVRDGGRTIRHDPPPPERVPEEMILGCLPHQATFARRTVFDRTGPFDLRWRRHADYDWWLKVLADPAIRVRRIGTLVASYALGGASSDLAKGQPEVHAIQNAAALYRSAEWDRRRIEIYQKAHLALRIELTQLQEAARGTAAAMPVATALFRPRPSLRQLAVRHLPDPAVRAIRSLKHGCVRLLRPSA